MLTTHLTTEKSRQRCKARPDHDSSESLASSETDSNQAAAQRIGAETDTGCEPVCEEVVPLVCPLGWDDRVDVPIPPSLKGNKYISMVLAILKSIIGGMILQLVGA